MNSTSPGSRACSRPRGRCSIWAAGSVSLWSRKVHSAAKSCFPRVAANWSIVEQLDLETYRKFFYPRQPVISASALVSDFAPSIQALFASLMKHAGSEDLLGMLGYPAEGWVFALFIAVDQRSATLAVREALRRLRIHVEASLRLRLFASADADAVIRPDGKLVHVRDGALDESLREAIGAQALNIDQARTKKGRADADRALSVWHALVEGRFSLVERVEPDGKRYYHAFENAPHVRTLRAITETEEVVLSLSLRGLSGKEVAYTTGLSPARISSALAAAAERLGFACREDLLRVGASLLHAEDDIVSVELTQAEQEVLTLVRRGLSNQEIADARGTSINTVANQLAALLRKTGATNRRALLVTAASRASEK
jgi:DNA-binding NarL/FixJ family response regulator